jgi:hypothetical protein
VETDPEILAAELHAAYERGKPHAIVWSLKGDNGEELALTFGKPGKTRVRGESPFHHVNGAANQEPSIGY